MVLTPRFLDAINNQNPSILTSVAKRNVYYEKANT